jgi:hypothetical protein
VITLEGLPALIAHVGASDDDDWIYAKPVLWEADPEHCEFYIISDDQLEQLVDAGKAQEINGVLWPDSFTADGITHFLQYQAFRGVIWALEDAELEWDDDLLVTAINYFLHNDSFMEHPARA